MIAKNVRVLPYNDKLVGSKRTDYSISDNDRGENAIMAEGRISDEEIQKVREASDLVALMGERSPMRQKGRDFWCCCPIHNEKTPSCKVDPSTQLWHCFGCGEGGDIFGFLMKVDGMSFPEAVQFLADKAHITLTRSGKDDGGASNSKKARLKQVCAETADFYHFQLMRVKSAPTDAARAYLAGRNLGGAIPREWMLGFAPGSGTLVRHLSSKGFTPDEMVEANVALRGDNGRVRDRFYNRIMFPIRDVQGDCIAFGGRIIGDGQPKYLNSQETPLFHKSTVLYGLDKAKTAMAATGDAIVVEGYTDVIALHRAGIDNAVATLGTALTRQHIRTLSRHAKNRIIYLFDGDEAGQRAADRALQFIDSSITPEAGRTRIDLCAVTLPDNLDPADFVEKRGAQALRECLAQAKPLLEYGIERRLSKHDLSTAEGRSRAFTDAIAVLAPIKDSLLAKDYATHIAGRTRTREEDAFECLEHLKAQKSSDEPQPVLDALPQEPEGVSLSSQEISRRKFERKFLVLCAQHPAYGLKCAETLAVTHWHERVHEALATSILDTLAADSSASAGTVVTRATESVPIAGSILTGTFRDDDQQTASVEAFARYLCEELALGDLSESIEDMKAQLSQNSLSDEERDIIFQTVVALQKDVQSRKKAMKPLI